LGWQPKTDLGESLVSIVRWNKARMNGQNMRQVCLDEIENYFQKE
jgi:hypothetical protein